MTGYMTEEEQLQLIRKWWQRNGSYVTLLISIILIGIAGYRYMLWHQSKLIQQSSVSYEHMMAAFSNHDIKSVRSYANELINNNSNTVYADVAHMTLAKIYVDKNKLKEAKLELKQISNRGNMSALKQVVTIRLARILAAEHSYGQALDELSTVTDSAYTPVINELKGDIYGDTGKYQEAINAYKLAINEIKNNGIGNLFLEMKSNELASKAQSVINTDKTEQVT